MGPMESHNWSGVRLQVVFFCNTRNETEGWSLREQRERRGSADFLASLSFPGTYSKLLCSSNWEWVKLVIKSLWESYF